MSSLLPFQKISRTYRHINRLRFISAVLIRNGLGFVFDRLRGKLPEGAEPENTQEKENLPASMPERLRITLTELGPTFVKLGQILAGRPDLMPREYIKELVKLQDQVSPFPYEEVRKTIKEEFAQEIEELFDSFEEEPIAAASIAQGHKATLKDGTEVFVKVRRPGIEQSIRADLEILTMLADFVEKNDENLRFLQPGKVIREFARSLEEELNLDYEMANIQRFARQFKDRKGLYVPKVWPKLCSEKVLTMEFIHGCKGTDIDNLEKYGIDRKKISSLGANLLLEQFFVHGFFHADPHPGNVFFLPGNRICYVDFGQVGRNSKEEREIFAAMVAAMYKRNERKAVKNLLKLSVYDKEPDLEILECDLGAFIDRYFYRDLEDMPANQILQEFYIVCNRHQIGLKAHIYLMFKALGVADDMGRKLEPDFRIADNLSPFLIKTLLKSLNPIDKFGQAKEISNEILEHLLDLPKQQRKLFQQLLGGQLQINHNLQGFERLQDFVNHGFSRLSLAVLQLGLLIFSAIIFLVEETPRIYGIPVFSLLALLAVAILYFLMFWDIFRQK